MERKRPATLDKKPDLKPSIQPSRPSADDLEEAANEALIRQSIDILGISGMYTGQFREKVIDFLSPLKKQQQVILDAARLEFDDEEDLEDVRETVQSNQTLINVLYSVTLRLDVDRFYPQNTASGSFISKTKSVHWIAKIKQTDSSEWKGKIWYKHGDIAHFLYTAVSIKVAQVSSSSARRAELIFSGGGLPDRTFRVKYQSRYFHNVEFEYDREQDVNPITAIQTHDHPNRPATIASESLSIEKVFRRAGFNVRKSGGDSWVPSSLKGANGTWSDMEMHDAMQTYWSKFQNAPLWSLWVFFAKQHDDGFNLGGIMFDDIGPQHRQGTAIFNDSFITDPPGGDPNPTAWVNRMKFWTAVHEMGHSFNLAHSWQKALGGRWLPTLANEPTARSFMNYPFRVAGGESSFFADFEYRFSNTELLFMRHSPAEFVQMGNSNWFEDHGFEMSETNVNSNLQLVVRTNRESNEFEFLEPVRVELKLQNVSAQPVLISDTLLSNDHNLTIIVKRERREAKVYRPFATRCQRSTNVLLNAGESRYENLLISIGKGGWLIDEPGYYQIQARIHTSNLEVLSAPMKIRVTPPMNYEASYISQDYFSTDVGRVLHFNGSLYFNKANDTLRELTDRLPDAKASVHANFALANPSSRDYKMLDFGTIDNTQIRPVADLDGAIKTRKANVKEADQLFSKAISGNTTKRKSEVPDLDKMLSSLGHIAAHEQMDKFVALLLKDGNKEKAKKIKESLLAAFTKRKVAPQVLKSMKDELGKL